MNTKEKIMVTAFVDFNKEGFNAVSINRIMQEVGLAKTTFFHYFKSKDELIDEVMETYYFSVANLFAENVLNKKNWQEKITEIFAIAENYRLYLDTLFEKIDAKYSNTLSELLSQYNALRNNIFHNSYNANNNFKYTILKNAIEEGKKLGEIKPDLDSESAALFLMCTQIGLKPFDLADAAKISISKSTEIILKEVFNYLEVL